MKRYEKHVFVCINQRDPGHPRGCCADKGSVDLHAKFKQKMKERKLHSVVRVNKSGCLDACEYGPSIVVYPEQIWYGGVTEDDLDEIIESHIVNNKPVERLFIQNKRYHKDG